jgi:hypothetical protein
MSAFGKVNSGDRDGLAGGREAVPVSGGAFGSLTRWTGLGAQMVTDLDAVKARYARVKGAENREAAREEAAFRRAEREAAAYAALDDLLADL